VPGQIIKATLTAPLGSGETLTVTSTGSATLGAVNAGTTTLTSLVIATSGGDVACTTTSCYFRVDNTVGENVTVTITGSGTLANTVTSDLGVTFTKSDATPPTATAGLVTDDTSMTTASTSTTPSIATISGASPYNNNTPTATFLASTANTSNSLSAFITAAPGAAKKTHWTVTDTSGKLTGVAGSKYSVPVAWGATALAAAEVTTTFAGSLLVTGAATPVYQTFTATLNATVPQVINVAGKAPAASGFTVTNASRRVAVGSTNSITATLADQYDAAVSNTSVTVTVAGRNGATASSTLVTDASGKVTYSLVDVGTVGTTTRLHLQQQVLQVDQQH